MDFFLLALIVLLSVLAVMVKREIARRLNELAQQIRHVEHCIPKPQELTRYGQIAKPGRQLLRQCLERRH